MYLFAYTNLSHRCVYGLRGERGGDEHGDEVCVWVGGAVGWTKALRYAGVGVGQQYLGVYRAFVVANAILAHQVWGTDQDESEVSVESLDF